MKRGMVVGAIGLLVVTASGCASEDSNAAGGGESNFTAAPTPAPATTTPAPAPATPTLATCGGRKECQDAFVLRALFSSTAKVKGAFGAEGDPPLAEWIAKWLGATETRATIRLTTKILDGNKANVDVGLGDADPDGATESGCSFKVTLDGDKVVERELTPQCAG